MASHLRLAALYARQSKEHSDGIDRQLPRLRAIAEARGWVVVGTYTDDDVSASEPRGPGTSWGRMLADADKGRINTVLAVDLDRLLRTTRDLNTLIDHGLMAVTVDGEIDLSTADGEFRATMLAGIARFEGRRKAERQRRAARQRAYQGKTPKGTRLLGYATDGSVVEREARIVKEIFRLFALADPPSLTAIAQGLSGMTGQKIPTTLSRTPKPSVSVSLERNHQRMEQGLEPKPLPADMTWNTSTIRGILRNPRYAGLAVYVHDSQPLRDADGALIKGQWRPLVEESCWHAVQARLDERVGTSARGRRSHLGTGLYLCGVCRAPVTAESRSYRCSGHIMRLRSHVDDYIRRAVKQRLVEPDIPNLVPALDMDQLVVLQADIDQNRLAIERAQADYAKKLILRSDLQRILQTQKVRITDLELQRKALAIDEELSVLFAADNPAYAFDAAALPIQRRTIDFFMDVHLLHVPRGSRGFDPTSVLRTPKQRA